MPTVSEFLIERLENIGVKHIFGVPGDYCLKFIDQIYHKDKIKFVNTTDENHAGFAADAYARVHGVGCVCATYNVGALKLCNSIAGAYAEKSPVILISGSPGIKERNEDFLLHHVVKSFDNQFKIFQHLTCYSAILDDATKAGWQIDNAIQHLMRHKQPIYIELPRDVAEQPIKYDVYRQGTPHKILSDEESLNDALEEISTWIKESKNPVIMAGVQITRFGLGGQLVRFAERHNIPMVTTLLGKSTIDEHHPLFAGVYCGIQTNRPEIQKLVDESDCLMIFGEILTDMMLGFQSPKFTKRQTIFSSSEGLKVKNHVYSGIEFIDFCDRFFKLDLGKKDHPEIPEKISVSEFIPQSDTKLKVSRFFEKVNGILTDEMVVVADIGECSFGASELVVSHHNFISPAFYCSMGPAIPGALGVQLAKPNVRPIVLVGDGAFQMSVAELSTILDHKLNPIIFVLNNKGYTTERFLLDGPFNNIRNWNYERVVDLLNGGSGSQVETEEQLEEIVKIALASKDLFVINVIVESDDISSGLRRLVENLGKRIK
jgi:indolepyruvate decarboxylase